MQRLTRTSSLLLQLNSPKYLRNSGSFGVHDQRRTISSQDGTGVDVKNPTMTPTGRELNKTRGPVKLTVSPKETSKRDKATPFDSLGMSLNTALHGKRSLIERLGPSSFTINGVRVNGSVLIMPLYSTLWNINSWDDICIEAFTIVKVAVPKPDILILGSGKTTLNINEDIKKWFVEIGVSLDVMDTKNACHTFNVLNQESRNIATALLPLGYTYDALTAKK